MSLTKNEPITPWYREPWAWLIVIILSATVIAGTSFIVYAFKIQDSVVVDDYYKNGKAINVDLTRDRNASEMKILAKVLIDDLTGEVQVSVTGDTKNWPEQLKFSLLSTVFKDKDKVLSIHLSPASTPEQAVYVGQLDASVSGKTYVQLETLDEAIPEVGYESGWRLNQPMFVESGKAMTLQAQQ